VIDFYDGQISDILPDNLGRDPVIRAMGFAISNQVKRLVRYCERSGVLASIDRLDEEVLDLLAVEFRSKYYGDWLSLGEKRAVIKRTLLWYCRAGTLSTVQELTDFVFQSAFVEEWFQYGAEAFLFRLIVNVISQDISLEKYLGFLKAVYGVKNTRSHLEAVIFKYHKDAAVKVVAAGGIGNVIKVKARVVRKIGAVSDDKPVSALFLCQDIRVRADNEIRKDEVYTLSAGGIKNRVCAENGRIVRIKS
jgi:P2-related tail formation protein